METKFIKANSKLIPRYTCGIYAIKNNLNGRIYIGSSTNIRARYEAHYRSLHNGKGINKKLQQDFDEIGCENFNFIIVEECADNISTIKYLESKYIHEYGYYNCCEVDGRKIYCYDRQGNYVREYDSVRQASRELNALPDNIRACCDGRKKSCCGFQWSYTKANRVDEYHVKEYEIKNKRPVVQLDYDGNTIIAQYDSIREASRATGVSRQSISDCLRKNARHKHAGGFTWRRVKIKEGQYDK